MPLRFLNLNVFLINCFIFLFLISQHFSLIVKEIMRLIIVMLSRALDSFRLKFFEELVILCVLLIFDLLLCNWLLNLLLFLLILLLCTIINLIKKDIRLILHIITFIILLLFPRPIIIFQPLIFFSLFFPLSSFFFIAMQKNST